LMSAARNVIEIVQFIDVEPHMPVLWVYLSIYMTCQVTVASSAYWFLSKCCRHHAIICSLRSFWFCDS
jgi:hypothetical protein